MGCGGERTPREPAPRAPARPRPSPRPAPRPAGRPPTPERAPRAPRRRRPKGGRAAPRRRRRHLPFSATSPDQHLRQQSGESWAPPRPGPRPRHPAAAALPTPRAPSAARPAPRCRRLPEPPADMGSIFQEPGDEEVELCAGERGHGGDTHRLSGRAAAAGGGGPRAGIAPAAGGPTAPTTRSQLERPFLSRDMFIDRRGRRRGRRRRGSGDGAAACPIAVSVCSRARTSAPPFKRRRRRRRRRRRKQQLSGKRLQPPPARLLPCGSLRRRKESAALRGPGLGRPAAPRPHHPGPEGEKGCLRPPPPAPAAPRAPRNPARRDPSPAAPGPKVRFIYLFPVEDVGAETPVGWKALSLWKPIAGGGSERASKGAGHGSAGGI